MPGVWAGRSDHVDRPPEAGRTPRAVRPRGIIEEGHSHKRWTMTVVVGVDGLHNSHAGIRLAREEADYRGVPLVAVIAYSGESTAGAPAGRPLTTPRTPEEQRKIAESTLRQAVLEALGDKDSGVELRTVPGSPGHVLVETARSL